MLELASLDDLMAHKLKVVLQRVERKDYRDLAAMIRAGCSVARGLAAARLFFGTAFQPLESLKAMAYFRDGDLGRLSRRDRDTLMARLLLSATFRARAPLPEARDPRQPNGRTPSPAATRRPR